MPPNVLSLPIVDGTLFIGPPDQVRSVLGALPASDLHASRLRDILERHAESWQVRNASVAWCLNRLGCLQEPERRLREQITRLVEQGSLAVGFAPLFRDDRRKYSLPSTSGGQLGVYQLAAGPGDAGGFTAQAPRDLAAAQAHSAGSARSRT